MLALSVTGASSMRTGGIDVKRKMRIRFASADRTYEPSKRIEVGLRSEAHLKQWGYAKLYAWGSAVVKLGPVGRQESKKIKGRTDRGLMDFGVIAGIMAITTSGGCVLNRGPDALADSAPMWSADGTKLAFSSDETGVLDI